MFKKRKYIGIAIIVCALALSSFVLIVWASPATIDDVYRRCWWIKKHAKETKQMMGQGLIGEMQEGNVDTISGEWVTVFSYNPPHPKKVSLYIDTGGMVLGDRIYVLRKVQMHGAWRDLEPFIYEMVPTPVANIPNLFLVLDQLPVETEVWVLVMQMVGNPFTLWWQSIIEEV